jgi:hypothetical protein
MASHGASAVYDPTVQVPFFSASSVLAAVSHPLMASLVRILTSVQVRTLTNPALVHSSY